VTLLDQASRGILKREEPEPGPGQAPELRDGRAAARIVDVLMAL